MSISKQIKELRDKADVFEKSGCASGGIVKAFREAAKTIESLADKLQGANMEQSDTISRSKLIEEIEKEIGGIIVKDTYSKGKTAGLRKAKIFAEEQKSECCCNQWIPCKKGNLPLKEVLCCSQSGDMIIGWPIEDSCSSSGFFQLKVMMGVCLNVLNGWRNQNHEPWQSHCLQQRALQSMTGSKMKKEYSRRIE